MIEHWCFDARSKRLINDSWRTPSRSPLNGGSCKGTGVDRWRELLLTRYTQPEPELRLLIETQAQSAAAEGLGHTLGARGPRNLPTRCPCQGDVQTRGRAISISASQKAPRKGRPPRLFDASPKGPAPATVTENHRLPPPSIFQRWHSGRASYLGAPRRNVVAARRRRMKLG